MSEGREWAVILGNTSGSGEAIARALATEPGLNVFGVHRGNHSDGVARVQEALAAAGGRYEELVVDAGKEANIQEAAAQVRERLPPGSVRIFVHSIANASLGHLVHPPEKRLHPKQIDKTFNSMAHSFLYWSRALLDHELLAPEARLLALTNAITDSTLANCSGVAAAKAALEMYVRYLAWELGPLGYRVNALKFGTVETTALEWIFPDGSWKDLKPIHERMFPAGRMQNVEEVGAFVSVLAGSRGAWFNGAVIDFTGDQMGSVYQLLCDHVMETRRAAEAAED